MTRDNDDGKPSDFDRAAILARRRHFIALALSGLATTACTSGGDKPDDGKSKQPTEAQPTAPADTGVPPEPCLKVAVPDDPPPEVPPQPCLNVAVPDGPPPEVPPQPCLNVVAPETPPPKIEEPPPEKPRPCLRKVAPRDL